MYKPKNPKLYRRKAEKTLTIFKKTGDPEKTAAKINRSINTVYRHLNFLGYTLPERGRDEFGRLTGTDKGAYLENLEKVK